MTRAIALVFLSALLLAGCESSDPEPGNPAAPSPTPTPTPPAGPARLELSASPARFLLTGGNTPIAVTARLTSATGAAQAGSAVQFTTTSGSLSAPQVTTGANGEATVTLTTPGSATVLASASGIDGSVNIVGVAPFTVAVTARYSVVGFGENADFMVTVTQAQGFANVPMPNSIRLNCGNGTSTEVGSSLQAACRYNEKGSYLVTATAASAGYTATATTTISMEPRPITLSLTSRRVAGSANEVEMEFVVVGAPAQSVCSWNLDATNRVGSCEQRYIYRRGDQDDDGGVDITVIVDTKQGHDTQTLELRVPLPF